MKIKIIGLKFIAVLSFFTFSFGQFACQPKPYYKKNQKRGKYKKRKPMPCPVKDC
jgi:hypothetical protein